MSESRPKSAEYQGTPASMNRVPSESREVSMRRSSTARSRKLASWTLLALNRVERFRQPVYSRWSVSSTSRIERRGGPAPRTSGVISMATSAACPGSNSKSKAASASESVSGTGEKRSVVVRSSPSSPR